MNGQCFLCTAFRPSCFRLAETPQAKNLLGKTAYVLDGVSPKLNTLQESWQESRRQRKESFEKEICP